VEVVDAAGQSHLLNEAAQIWAEATAARDGRPEVAELADSRPVIQALLDRSAQAFVLIARSPDGVAGGFVAIEPVAGRTEATAEVMYIGVSPPAWGQGVGETLLVAACKRLRADGYATVELSVYVDNTRAKALYERLGWQSVGPPTPHIRTGKPEQRYELRL
jgi:ribosomal protein S18 acetylase RimI-like enzyme